MTALVYTVEETAELLGIGRSAAYEAVRRGDIPAIRIGRSLRVPRRRLEALLDSENDNAAPAGGDVPAPGGLSRHGED